MLFPDCRANSHCLLGLLSPGSVGLSTARLHAPTIRVSERWFPHKGGGVKARGVAVVLRALWACAAWRRQHHLEEGAPWALGMLAALPP